MDVTDSMVEEAVNQSDMYPRPDREMVRKNMKKISIVESSSKRDLTRNELVNRVARIARIKKKVENTEWIEYNGETMQFNP